MKPYLPSLTILSLALMALMTYSFTTAQWISPTQAPTGGNTPPPIEVGNSQQTKTGDIAARVMAANSFMASNLYCDRNGHNCFTAAQIFNLLNPETTVRFVTQWDALRRDPAFLAFYGPGASLPSGGSFRDDRGWGRHGGGPGSEFNRQTYDRICSFMMNGGRWDRGDVWSPNWSSDNNNTAYLWDGTQWVTRNYGYQYGLDAVHMNCVGRGVTANGEWWRLTNRPEGCGSRHMCQPYPIPTR